MQRSISLSLKSFCLNEVDLTCIFFVSFCRSADEEGKTVYVSNLYYTVTEAEIRQLFSTCGEVCGVRMLRAAGGRSRGLCYVEYADKASALRAVGELDGTRPTKGGARAMHVQISAPPKHRTSAPRQESAARPPHDSSAPPSTAGEGAAAHTAPSRRTFIVPPFMRKRMAAGAQGAEDAPQ